ncbi:MAG TPA: hypothetical protein ENK33_10040 [Desulfobacterales bacterium]|nr:hypothetical protein [Desulfobacterales bacterium]
MKKVNESVTLTISIMVYLLLSVRYFPDEILKTLAWTGMQILTVSPLTVGGTFIIVVVLQKAMGVKIPRDRIVRIFLTLGIIVELLYGLYNYVGVKGV